MKTESLANSDAIPVVTSDTIKELIEEDVTLPSPWQQVTNIVRFVGDYVSREFDSMQSLPPHFPAIVGAPNRRFAEKIVRELLGRGILSGVAAGEMHHPDAVIDIGLTLAGWEVYESEKHGQVTSNFGFIALKFGDTELDPLLSHHVKPKLAELGYPLVDLRDVSRAGVIDNILRAQIRDSKFVIVDLTHDNLGAYWEAGYAEGLGKPVIYICERSRFEAQKTHFDTNHCTTVMWDTGDPETFVAELKATIRRSIEFS